MQGSGKSMADDISAMSYNDDEENHCRIVSMEGIAACAIVEHGIIKDVDIEEPTLWLFEKLKHYIKLQHQ